MRGDVLFLNVIFPIAALAAIVAAVIYTELRYWLDKKKVEKGEMTKKEWFLKWHYSGDYYLGDFKDE